MSDNPGFGQAVTVVVPFVGWGSESPVVSTDEHVTQGLARPLKLAPVPARKQLPASLNLYPRKNSHEASIVAP